MSSGELTVTRCRECGAIVYECWKIDGKKRYRTLIEADEEKRMPLKLALVESKFHPKGGRDFGLNAQSHEFVRGKILPRNNIQPGERYQEIYLIHTYRCPAARARRNLEYRQRMTYKDA